MLRKVPSVKKSCLGGSTPHRFRAAILTSRGFRDVDAEKVTFPCCGNFPCIIEAFFLFYNGAY